MANARRWAVALVLLWPTWAAAQQEQVLWQIGKRDRDYAELAIAGHHGQFAKRFGTGVRFRIGKDKATESWPFIHPGPDDQWAGGRRHPFTIEFDMPQAPSGYYELRIALVSAQSRRPPRYVVEVNGRSREVKVQAGRGDEVLTNPRAGLFQLRSVPFDASLLKRGANRIVLQCAAGSWVIYDSIELVHHAGTAVKRITGLRASPTIFFVRRDGRLRRLVHVSPVGGVLFEAATLEADIAGEHFKHEVSADPFGNRLIELAVPDLEREAELKLALSVAGKTYRAAVPLKPARKWKIFIAPASHVDIGYTHLQHETAAVQSANIDQSILLCEKYATFKWNTESAWVLQHYLATRNEEQIKRMAALTRAGRLGIEAFHSNLLTGLCSDEELFRSLYYAHWLERKYGWPRRSAMLTDAPSHVWSVPSVLANCGIRYLSMGINPTRAPLLPHGNLNQLSPVWWEGPDGSRVLAMFHNHYAQARLVGAHSGVEAMKITVPLLIARFRQRGDQYPYDAIHLHGAYGDNRTVGEPMARAIEEWNRMYEYPKVMLTTNNEFFEYIEKQYGERLPTVRGDGGNYWEDGAGSSARETGINRDNARRAVAAELLWALLSATARADYPQQQFARIWNNILLYDEHTWGAYNSITQPELDFVKKQFAVKASYATDAAADIGRLQEAALERLGKAIGGSGQMLLVVNAGPLDAQQAVVSAPGRHFLVSVPAFSYRAIPLDQAEEAQPATGEAETAKTVIESKYYRVQVDPQRVGIVSIVDKESGRELVDRKSPWLAGQYLYCSGGENTKAVRESLPKEPHFDISTPKPAQLHRFCRGPNQRSLRLETSANMTPKLTVEITVYDNLKRIEVVGRFTKTKTYKKEAVYFAFPFAAAKPAVDYEIGGAVVRVNRDWLSGACKDWFSVQDWVRVRDQAGSGYDIVWSSPDAPLIQLCDIQTGKWLKELKLTNGTVLSYALNNYWFTNYQAGQGGQFQFRYSITSGRRIDNGSATRFGRAAGLPLLARLVRAGGQGTLPTEGTLAAVEPQNVIVQAIKGAETGSGIVVRLREVAGRETTATVRLPLIQVRSAQLCNGLEEPVGPLSVSDGTVEVALKPLATATVLLQCGTK